MVAPAGLPFVLVGDLQTEAETIRTTGWLARLGPKGGEGACTPVPTCKSRRAIDLAIVDLRLSQVVAGPFASEEWRPGTHRHRPIWLEIFPKATQARGPILRQTRGVPPKFPDRARAGTSPA